MSKLKDHSPMELTEFEREWHQMQLARTALEWTIVLAVIVFIGYAQSPYYMH